MVDVEEVAENIYMIDDKLYSVPGLGSVYLIDEEKKALIDSGPSTSADAVLDGIKRVGVNPDDIDYIIITHIHLDHAGGAGVLIKDMPQAQVVVHHSGARYLVNPARLVSSVAKVQGEEGMKRYGEVVPIGKERVKPIYGGDVLKLGEEQALKFIDAPGHAPHEICIYESQNNGLFAGDAVGIYLAEYEVLLPVTPPPSFDSELFVNTLERLMGLNASMIYFAHFGATDKVQENLRLAADKLMTWDSILSSAIKGNKFDGVAEKMMARDSAELEPVSQAESLYEYLINIIVPMNVNGYIKYYQEKYGLN